MNQTTKPASLRWQLFIRLALLVLALIPMFGVARYYFAQESLSTEFKERREGAAEVLAVSLREPLWDLDDKQVAEAVSAFSYMPELQAVKIIETGSTQYERLYMRNETSDILTSVESTIRSSVEANLLQPFTVMFREAELATGVLYFSDARYKERLRETLIELVVQMVLFSFIVLALIYLLLEQFIGTPLVRLQKAVASSAESESLGKVSEALPNNEIRSFALQYARVLTDLRNHQQHLTEMVLQRTRALSDSNEQLGLEIEQRTRIEQELIGARLQAEQASEAKTYFLAHMSHELRTPLNGIIGYSQLLSQGVESEHELNEYVNAIGRCADHLLELINRILDLSKIEHGRMEINAGPFHLQQLLDDVIAVIQPRADSKHLALNQRREEDIPDHVIGDSAKLKQTLINLLGNAVKFTERGSVTLDVRWLGDERIAFIVRDTGVGIEQKDLERIFEPFQQAGALPQQWSQEGTGLGLAISRRFVELMGSELIVDSDLEKGTQFSFILKLPVSDVAPESLASHKRVKLADGENYRVLVVDDVAHNRDALARQLMRMGFSVETADSGQSALDRMEQFQAQLVFMDIRMPGMDGISCAKRMREKYPTTAILAFTASVFDVGVNSEISHNFDELILKPVDLQQVIAAIQKCLPVRFQSLAEPALANEYTALKANDLSEEELARLNSWLAAGALVKIREFANALKLMDGSKVAIGERLFRLAKAYDIEGLSRFLQRSNTNES